MYNYDISKMKYTITGITLILPGAMLHRDIQNRINPTENCKSNQIKSKSQKFIFVSDVFESFFNKIVRFCLFCGLCFANRIKIKPNRIMLLLKFSLIPRSTQNSNLLYINLIITNYFLLLIIV